MQIPGRIWHGLIGDSLRIIEIPLNNEIERRRGIIESNDADLKRSISKEMTPI